ncbi:MAG: divalent metal cation transporter [Chloroflexota bacterium]
MDAASVIAGAQAAQLVRLRDAAAAPPARPGAVPRAESGPPRDRATSLGHAELIRERYGLRWGPFAVTSMVAIDLVAYVAEFAGIVLGASIVGVPPAAAVGGALVFHTVIVLTASYARFERIALALSLGLFAFIPLAIAARPEPGAVLGGLLPAAQFGHPGYLELVAATVGAVVMPWMLFYQQAASVDKGLGRADLRAARFETLVGSVASQALMAAVVVAAAAAVASGAQATISAGGLVLPAGLAGLAVGGGAVLVAVGMVGAGLLAAIVISLSSAWAWAELFRWPRSLNLSVRRAPMFYGLYLVEIVPAAAVALLASDLVSVVVNAMVINVLVLAIPLTFLIRLSSDRSVVGDLANSRRRQAVLWAITAMLLGLGVWSTAAMISGS